MVNKRGKCRGKKRKFSTFYPFGFWVKVQYFPVPPSKLTSPIMNDDFVAQKKNPPKNESYESMCKVCNIETLEFLLDHSWEKDQ